MPEARAIENLCLAPDEHEALTLRDEVFEVPSSISNWLACRERWMRPDGVAWLREKANRPLTAASPQGASVITQGSQSLGSIQGTPKI